MKRAPRQDLSGYSAEERVERRKTRARAYSQNARVRNKALLQDIQEDVGALAIFRTLVEEAPHIVLVLSMDLKGTVLYANEALNDVLHLPPATLLGRYAFTYRRREAIRPSIKKTVVWAIYVCLLKWRVSPRPSFSQVTLEHDPFT